ncbi:MAG: hypothetical protein Q8M01_17905 [Rubrivivax sp.]|nr:hypothetical protein [Rubrivivax sp.]
MPEIVNMSDTKKAAFARGFWKGMAAPLMLFSAFDLSAQQAQQTFRELPKRASGGQTSDWVRVGEALRTAAKKVRESGGK